jgi:hypothetical protein
MFTIRQRLFAFLGIVFFFGCATFVSAADDSNKKFSDARENDYRVLGEADLEYANFMQTKYIANATSSSELEQVSFEQSKYITNAVSSFEKALPALMASQDFRSVSKVYFQLAIAHNRLNETQAACVALSQSLDYYREALAKDKLSPAYSGEMTSDGSNDGDGMQEVRSKFGCEDIQSASSPQHATTTTASSR